ncbi:MAG: TetR/AcrR family transcriptional regulator [Proteobacteria bacterium]|nr:TetR/AcrR family transcriptional regulator [Pseudomonadota bacterium]
MTGVRSAQKAERRERMLEAASRLFARRGFAQTTFEEIAESAGFGVATVYKYFGSKEGIVVALLEPELAAIMARGEEVIAQPPADPADAMMALMTCYARLGGGWAPREILRLTIFPGLGNEAALTALVRRSDASVRRQVRALLETMQRTGRVAPGLDLRSAADVVFALLNQHFGAFLSNPELRFGQVLRSLERTVRVVFEDWRAAPGPGRARRGSERSR